MMIDFNFRITGVEVTPLAATPQLCFALSIESVEGCREVPIQSVLLRVQVRIEPTRRAYVAGQRPGLRDLFGEPERWGATMRSLLWTHTTVLIPGFEGSTGVDLPIECSFDFNVAATKYFASLDDGEIPLCFLFSGTCFYQAEQGLQAAQISWEREASYRLPAATWKEMMEQYYPRRVWLSLDRSVLEQLHEFKSRRAIPTWEQAIEELVELEVERSAVKG